MNRMDTALALLQQRCSRVAIPPLCTFFTLAHGAHCLPHRIFYINYLLLLRPKLYRMPLGCKLVGSGKLIVDVDETMLATMVVAS